MSASTQDVAEKLATLIEQSPTKTLLGSSLTPLLRLAFPGFAPVDYGSPNLRHFVRTNVPTVHEVGRQGVDIVYGLQSTGNAASTHPSAKEQISSNAKKPRRRPVEPRVWKTFVSPSERYQLFGNRLSGELRIVEEREVRPRHPWTRIPSCSPEVHREIAEEFISSLQDEEHKNSLRATLNQPGWWNIFFFTVQKLGLAMRWGEHRKERLLDLFTNAMQKECIPPLKEKGPSVASSLAEDTSKNVSRTSSASVSKSSESLRRIAMGAIERMSLSELRALNIPLGHIIDELQAD